MSAVVGISPEGSLTLTKEAKAGVAEGIWPIRRGTIMPKYLSTREIPGAGNMPARELQGASRKSCEVLQNQGPRIQWVQSYVTADMIQYIYIAPSAADIRRHAELTGFPAKEMMEVKAIIDPMTADG